MILSSDNRHGRQTTLAGMDGEDNHVHLLVNYPPKHSVSTLANSLKDVSSRMLRQELCGPHRTLPPRAAPIAILKTFIQQQKTPL
jgi:putative transposase